MHIHITFLGATPNPYRKVVPADVLAK